MGEMWPPARVKTNFTPWALSTSATNSPPCLLDVGSALKIYINLLDKNSENRENIYLVLPNIQNIQFANN